MLILQLAPFNSEQYWKSVFQNGLDCTMGSILGIIITYAIYRATTKQNRLEREALEASNNRNTKDYFSIAVKSMMAICKQQRNSLIEFQRDIAKDPTTIPLLGYVPMYEFHRVSQSQNLDKVLLSFSSVNPGNRNIVTYFSNLIAAIDYLNAQFYAVVKQTEKAQMFDHERKTTLQVMFTQINSLVVDLLSLKTYTYSPAFRQVIESTKAIYEKKRSNPTSLQFAFTEFIEPLKNQLEILHKSGDKSPESYQLGEMTAKAISLYENMQLQILSVAKDLKEVEGQITEIGINPLHANAILLNIVKPEEIKQEQLTTVTKN